MGFVWEAGRGGGDVDEEAPISLSLCFVSFFQESKTSTRRMQCINAKERSFVCLCCSQSLSFGPVMNFICASGVCYVLMKKNVEEE